MHGSSVQLSAFLVPGGGWWTVQWKWAQHPLPATAPAVHADTATAAEPLMLLIVI